MFFLHPSDMGTEVERLLVIAVPYARLHHLRDLQHLQEVGMAGEGQRVQLTSGKGEISM